MNLLEARGVGKRFRGGWGLRDCTLALPAGRVVALVGPNGAGKTTLLNMAVGLSRPTTGHLTVAGGLAPGSVSALTAIAFVAQDTPLFAGLSVADTVRLVAGWSPALDTADAHTRLADLGIPLRQRVGSLSGGQRAQVALAVALARHPQLLILDEPLARLDPLARHEFLATLLTAVAEHGVSVVFSSHVLGELERVCDYLVVLNAGRVQLLGEVEQLLTAHRIWTGPAEQVPAIAGQLPVVRRFPGERQARLLVRATDHDAGFPAWTTTPTNLEELVLSYLHSPEATMLPGPIPQHGADAGTRR